MLVHAEYGRSKIMRHLAGNFKADLGGWLVPQRLDVINKLEDFGAELTPEAMKKKQELIKLDKALQSSKLAGSTETLPLPVRTKPFDHQRVAFKVGTDLPAAGLFMEQGCGKTLAAIAVAGHRMLHHNVQFLLVVCPAVVVPVWPREFAEHANFPHKVIPLIADHSTKKMDLVMQARESARPGELMVVVVNFESAWRIESALEPLVKKQMIVVDESQRIKSSGAQQSKCMHRLGRLSKYRLILSGTPITQNPLDLYSQYKFLEPSMFGSSYTVFRNRYAIMGGFEGRQVVSYQRLDELMRKAHSIAYRVTKAEALDLPDEITTVRPVLLPAKIKKMYKELMRESILQLEIEERGAGTVVATNVLTKLLRLQQLTSGNLTDDERNNIYMHDAKLSALEDELETILDDSSRKVVIFARFIWDIRQIVRMLERLKVGHRWISGEVKMDQRGEHVEAFQNDPDVRVMVAQIATAGLGITLTAGDTAIFYSMDYSLANHEQAKARIHRIGQRHPVTYMYLLCEGTIDESIFEAVRNKKSVADMVVDNWRSILK